MSSENDVWSAIAEMEPEVADIARWGMVLRSIGTSDYVETEAVFVLGGALMQLSERLRGQFEAALEVAKRERRPCA
jgi:hypothetical protein